MAKQSDEIDPVHAAFIAKQRIFFVASAAASSRVNVSPRGTDAFRIIAPRKVAYLDRTGSGNETSAHIKAGGAVTIMFCALEGPPLILRLYGKGQVHRIGSIGFSDLLGTHFDGEAPPGARQIVVLDVEMVQTSCGYGVPFFDYAGDRDTLDRWAEHKGEIGIRRYRMQTNVTSIDGLPTGLLD